MSITSMSTRSRMAENLSIPQLQQAIQSGSIPAYVGLPLLQDKMKMQKEASAMAGQQKQPTIADQVMAEAAQAEQGVPSLPSNLPASMAGGGIVAFADGGMYDEEDTDEDRIDAAREQEMNDLMDEYAQSFQGGIGQLPAAREAAPQGKENDTDFIARIMHKESRGQRYGKDGKLLTSEKGAQGEMQVMPGTSRDPGFGVKAAQNDSPDELARVGRDYANTLLARYKDPKIAAIAYNMGPGATDKWLMAGADMSKLPKETQGYVRGFAGGGDVEDDYTTIDGLEPSDLYAQAIRKARAAREKEAAVDEEPTKPGLWPYNSPDAGKFSYEDAAKFDARKKDEEPKSSPTAKPGITYAPNSGIGNVTPTRYIPKESNERESEMMRAVKTPFRALGSGIASLYGGKAGMPSDTDYTASGDLAGAIMGERGTSAKAPVAQGIQNIPRGRPTMANDPRLGGAKVVAPPVQDESVSGIDLGGAGSSPANTGSQAGAQAAGETAKVDPNQEIRDLLKKRYGNVDKQREQDRYMALLSAGLGMMGGTSRHAFANIGAGAQQGVASLMASNKDRTAEENALLAGEIGLSKIGASQRQADAMMQLRKDLAGQTNERLKQTATEQSRLRQDALDERTRKDLAGQLGQMEKLATTRYLAKMKSQIIPGQEGVIEAQALEALRADPAYRKLYQTVHGIDPMAGAGGDGTRMSAERAGQFKVER